MESMTLTLNQVKANLKTVDFSKFEKPARNKGGRGQLLELALGISNSSSLLDCVDGELKSFTQGESIAVTQLKHILPEIIGDNFKTFSESKVGLKLRNTLYVGFDRQNNYLGSVNLSETTNPEHYAMLEEDFEYIGHEIQMRWIDGQMLSTITGLNGLLQIRTKDSKDKKGNYHPIYYNGDLLSNKSYAFYLCGKFGRELL
tara:strand:- start:141 stop:743 length:603 start_codon:yes stop_codon:yes gene_type:complete